MEPSDATYPISAAMFSAVSGSAIYSFSNWPIMSSMSSSSLDWLTLVYHSNPPTEFTGELVGSEDDD